MLFSSAGLVVDVAVPGVVAGGVVVAVADAEAGAGGGADAAERVPSMDSSAPLSYQIG